jgi:hypothetical protein
MQTQLKSFTGDRTGNVQFNIAAAMIGRSVGLILRRKKIVHGVVSAVSNVAGMPKLVVDGTRYDLKRILTVMPAAFN